MSPVIPRWTRLRMRWTRRAETWCAEFTAVQYSLELLSSVWNGSEPSAPGLNRSKLSQAAIESVIAKADAAGFTHPALGALRLKAAGTAEQNGSADLSAAAQPNATAPTTVRARPGRLSALRVHHRKYSSHGLLYGRAGAAGRLTAKNGGC